MMENIMEKVTFSEIYKIVKDNRNRNLLSCFHSVFDVGLLFFPSFMCKEVAFITNIANGVNLLVAKQTITTSTKNIMNTFKDQKYTDYRTRYENMLIAHMLITYAAFLIRSKSIFLMRMVKFHCREKKSFIFQMKLSKSTRKSYIKKQLVTTMNGWIVNLFSLILQKVLKTSCFCCEIFMKCYQQNS